MIGFCSFLCLELYDSDVGSSTISLSAFVLLSTFSQYSPVTGIVIVKVVPLFNSDFT